MEPPNQMSDLGVLKGQIYMFIFSTALSLSSLVFIYFISNNIFNCGCASQDAWKRSLSFLFFVFLKTKNKKLLILSYHF